MWAQITSSEFVLENLEQFLKARPSILITDCKGLYDAIHKEVAAPASTDKRLAIELATVKAKVASGETDLRWIDERYQIQPRPRIGPKQKATHWPKQWRQRRLCWHYWSR